MWNVLAIILHLLAINVWVGGTFFTVVILNRATDSLEPKDRHRLMRAILRRFFFWVWMAVLILLGSGVWMIYNVFGGLDTAPLYVVWMMGIAILMMSVFLLTFFGPWRQYQQAIAHEDMSSSQRHLGQIRLLSKINMGFGICVLLVIGGGPRFLV